MITSTISQNGQTTIPSKVRRFLGLGPSDQVVFQFEGNRVFLEPAAASTAALYGCFETGKKPPSKQALKGSRKAYLAKKYGR